ncbi:hypothetical protein ACU4GD_33455 [Cupriavidus basilensis]
MAHDISAYSFPGAGQGRTAHAVGQGGLPLPLTYSGRGARGAELQHHGPGQSLAGSQRAPSGAALGRPARHPCQRHPRQALIKTLVALRHQGLRQAAGPYRGSSAAAPQCDHRRGRQRRSLLSDLASGVTGEITYVDAGFNTVGASLPGRSVIRVRRRLGGRPSQRGRPALAGAPF